jgi:uncharacterized protein (TIGR00266 family)
MDTSKLQTLRGTHLDGDAGINLEYEINGRPGFATVTFNLKPEQKITAEAGSLMWCDEQLKVDTHISGSLLDAFWRGCSYEPCCMNDYTGPGKVTIGFVAPGDALPFAVTPDSSWIITKAAFMCSTPDVEVSARFAGCLTTLCTTEGPFFTKVSTKAPLGVFWAGGYGEIIRHEIPDGKSMIVDGGLFFAAAADTNCEVTLLGNICTACCSGEGIVMKFQGPAVIYCQSRDPAVFNAMLSVPAPPEAANQAAQAAS